MQFTVEFQADILKKLAAAMRREIASPGELLGSIGESLFNVNRERHNRGVDLEGNPWAPLKASTLAEGNRKGGPLNKAGRMLRNFHYQVHGSALRLGFDNGDGFPARYHQDGSRPHVISAKKGAALKFAGDVFRRRVNHPGFPARTLVGFPASDRQLVKHVAEDHLTAVLKRVR